jgi:predicted nucleic acid-binding protein
LPYSFRGAADTSFWIGLRFRRDDRHLSARAIWAARPGPLLTTTLVIGETRTFLARRAGHQRAVGFLGAVSRLSRLTVRHVDEDLDAACSVLRAVVQIKLSAKPGGVDDRLPFGGGRAGLVFELP